MVRIPCCEKMGMKKGPWTPQEDQILIAYIQRYGHGNWRALPKQAGLSRCGKSCRLRWINYLRPDIKRGNFTNEEDETIIKLHQVLGNRRVQWSAIAARLPGRTDNEIKNYWHGHLKKKLKQNLNTSVGVEAMLGSTTDQKEIMGARIELQNQIRSDQTSNPSLKPSISFPNSQEHSSSTTCLPQSTTTRTTKEQAKELMALTREQQGAMEQPVSVDHQSRFSYVSLMETLNKINGSNNNIDANREFWYKLFMENSNHEFVRQISGDNTGSFPN